ncbi:MAG: DUF447 family protein [Candidatus Pacebacteria bacterium]|nr:DUF447 family protein [Candidatus Paceibacterota bacterium]
MIQEIILTTVNADGSIHLAPMGLTLTEPAAATEAMPAGASLAPFAPSRSLDNLARRGTGVINICDDVRVFAGCLTGRRDWPTVALAAHNGEARLAEVLGYRLVSVKAFGQNPERPRFICSIIESQQIKPFNGFCRAQSAVIEAAILVSRFNRTPARDLIREFEQLATIVDKTAGAVEFEAWGWLQEAFEQDLAKD